MHPLKFFLVLSSEMRIGGAFDHLAIHGPDVLVAATWIDDQSPSSAATARSGYWDNTGRHYIQGNFISTSDSGRWLC